MAYNARSKTRCRTKRGDPVDPFELAERLRVVLAEQARHHQGALRTSGLPHHYITRGPSTTFENRKLVAARGQIGPTQVPHPLHSGRIASLSSDAVAENRYFHNQYRPSFAIESNARIVHQDAWVSNHRIPEPGRSQMQSYVSAPVLPTNVDLPWQVDDEKVDLGELNDIGTQLHSYQSSDFKQPNEVDCKRTLRQRIIPFLMRKDSSLSSASRNGYPCKKQAFVGKAQLDSPNESSKDRKINIFARLKRHPRGITLA